MIIKVNVKQLEKKRSKICGVSFILENAPSDVRMLISEAVRTCVREYNKRVIRGERISPLSSNQISEMSEIGKIAFGINYNGKLADENAAAENALQGYEDGLYRIFIGENEAGDLSDKIDLSDNDSVTFIRLTMLTGRLW